MSSKTYRQALAEAMTSALSEHQNTFIIGQGVTDFKALFGTTEGLAASFPGRVIETPIAEDSIAGICIGAALNGMYPINTHIRADFSLLIFNQLLNLAAKYKYMFGGLFEVPMMIRLIIGRSWGQGAQHSQSLQSLLAHVPGLVVVMPSNPSTIIDSYQYAVQKYKGPVVMLEHRLMYELEFESTIKKGSASMFGSLLEREGTDLTIVATSIMVVEARRAAQYLQEYGISLEVIDLHSISHPDHELIYKSVSKTGKLIVADTSWPSYGVCAEINRVINERDPSILKKPPISLGMSPSPCPTAKALEDLYYPEISDIVEAVRTLLDDDDSRLENLSTPARQSMSDFYKKFRGPF